MFTLLPQSPFGHRPNDVSFHPCPSTRSVHCVVPSCIELHDAGEAHNLQPSQCWNFGESRQTIGNFCKFDVLSTQFGLCTFCGCQIQSSSWFLGKIMGGVICNTTKGMRLAHICRFLAWESKGKAKSDGNSRMIPCRRSRNLER